MREIQFAGGTTIAKIAAGLVDIADLTGEATWTTVGNTVVMANPGTSAESVLRRHEEDLAAKSAWFGSPNGRAFVDKARSRTRP